MKTGQMTLSQKLIGLILLVFVLGIAIGLVMGCLTPRGQTIWHRGILPDRTIRLPAEVGPLVPRTGKKITSQELKESRDLQLQAALELLK
jgi:hypothetical protein